MTPSAASCGTGDSAVGGEDRLVLPVDRAFRPVPPRVSLEVLIERSADLRRWLPQGIPTEEQRLQSKCEVEFRIV